MTIKNYTFFSQSGTEFPISATADRRLYLMLGGMDYSTFKMTHWKTPTNTALNRVYNDTSLVLGGAYFELNNQSITLRANSTNFIHINIDLSNVNNPVDISTETKDNSNSIDMNTTSSVLKKCIEVVTTSGTEILTVTEKEQETKLKKVTADSVTIPTKTAQTVLNYGITANFTRIGNLVHVNFFKQTKTVSSKGENEKILEKLPTGFRPSFRAEFGININSSTAVYPQILYSFNELGEVFVTNNYIGTGVFAGSTMYFTNDTMPVI
ncbi:hypothetical protein [Pseudolactococcus paracarnosus]|uniref:hypothetical protein n=1 Tax=Pseudolactococcus paracarnosus TaxID=2749962 RepID=UPI001FBB5096|nr:hypothetical protein [Lactococcus paracarnosus]MCJ1998488.1 hypothetical protein [Lactococcus paracarnosus]